ncbi:MAG TPA: TonB-dependent receptor [Gemmatimonadaceae bacterium]|nr:TonB-dependent receptor [Gemmatimonadaceae bacterium]
MKLQRFWSLFLALAFPLVAGAQATVHGTVVDHQTGGPIAGALVTVTGTMTIATTNDSGKFTLRSTGAISSITTTRVGYAPAVTANPSDGVRIELTVATTELPGVQVVATNPAPSTAVLTQSDLNRASGLSLMDAINTLPGIFMQSRTPFGGSHIMIRGYFPSFGGNSPNSNGSGYDVFVNDIPITDATGITVLDDVDFSTLGSVHVIKGPASSLYGSFIGGTVNMTTARPAPDQTSVNQQYLGGGDGLLRTNTSIQSASENSDYVLNYGDQADNSFRRHSESRKQYARASGDFGVTANQSLSAFFSYDRSYEELAGEIDSTDFYARRPVSDSFYVSNNSHIQITSFFTGVTDNYRINDHFTNATTVFGSSRFSDQPIAHGYTDATQLNGGGRTSFGFTGQLGNTGVDGTLGGMIQRSNVTSDGASIGHTAPYAETPSASENLAQNSYLFTEWTFALPSEVAVTAGGDLIYDVWQVHNLLVNKQIVDTIPSTQWLTKHFAPTFAPRLAVTKGIGASGSVYASWSTGYAPPLLSNITASNGTVNTNLKPERGVQYEVGAQGTLVSRLTGQVSLFDIDNTNKLVSQSVGGVTSVVNVGKQRNEGAEVSLSYLAISDSTSVLSRLRPWASYTYTDAKYLSFYSDNNNNAATVNYSGNTVARVPKIMDAAGVDAASNTGLYFTSTYQFVGKVPVTYDNSTWVHSYGLLGAKIGYTRPIDHRWTLDAFVGGDNLTNSTYYTFVFIGPNYAGLAQSQDGGSGDGYILPGDYKARYYANINLSYIIK